MFSVPRLLACLFPLAIAGCAWAPPAPEAPVARPAPIPNFPSQVLVRRTPPTPAPTGTAPTTAKPAQAPVAVDKPGETELPVQALPTWRVAPVAALSDAEALGPIVERPVPHGSNAHRPSVFTGAKPTAPPARTVSCKAERTRQGLDEKITVSCNNNGKQTQTVFLQINAVGLAGLPSPDEVRAGYPIPPGKSRTLATLTTVSRPARADIAFTTEARP